MHASSTTAPSSSSTVEVPSIATTTALYPPLALATASSSLSYPPLASASSSSTSTSFIQAFAAAAAAAAAASSSGPSSSSLSTSALAFPNQFSFLQPPNIMTASSSSPPTPLDQRYRDKRSRNNAAVKKCREIKRKHEKETIEELAKERKKFKQLTEEQYILETEVKIIQELIPYCRNKRQSHNLLPTTSTHN